jgi:hypothetical protein
MFLFGLAPRQRPRRNRVVAITGVQGGRLQHLQGDSRLGISGSAGEALRGMGRPGPRETARERDLRRKGQHRSGSGDRQRPGGGRGRLPGRWRELGLSQAIRLGRQTREGCSGPSRSADRASHVRVAMSEIGARTAEHPSQHKYDRGMERSSAPRWWRRLRDRRNNVPRSDVPQA